MRKLCVDRANELRADKPARQVVKAARWLLLKNRESLAAGQDVQFKKSPRRLCRASLEKLVFQSPSHPHRAPQVLPGILAHGRFPLGIKLVEGINNKIKVIKRMVDDFRDHACFFLKIRAAFPGVG